MTREEAIYELRNAFRYNVDDSFMAACDMAIKALSAPQTNLISRSDVIEEISMGVWNECELIDRIDALPSADAEEMVLHKILEKGMIELPRYYYGGDPEELKDYVAVVRCKDCKWEFICKQTVEQANADDVEHRPLEWCSYGERSTK